VSWRGSLQVAGFRRVMAWVDECGGLCRIVARVAATGGSFLVSMAWFVASGGPARVRGLVQCMRRVLIAVGQSMRRENGGPFFHTRGGGTVLLRFGEKFLN
jgi:hypothetical protein